MRSRNVWINLKFFGLISYLVHISVKTLFNHPVKFLNSQLALSNFFLSFYMSCYLLRQCHSNSLEVDMMPFLYQFFLSSRCLNNLHFLWVTLSTILQSPFKNLISIGEFKFQIKICKTTIFKLSNLTNLLCGFYKMYGNLACGAKNIS